jgi:hypothetical protein
MIEVDEFEVKSYRNKISGWYNTKLKMKFKMIQRGDDLTIRTSRK